MTMLSWMAGREDDSKSDSDDESRATRCCMVSTDKGNNGTVSIFR